MTQVGFEPGSLHLHARRATTTATVGYILQCKNVVHIINVSGLRFCRNVGEVSARIVAFKAPSTANEMDYKHFKKHCVFSEDGRFISSISGVDTWRNRGATCVPKSADRQTDGFSSLYSRLAMYLPYRAGVNKC